MKKIWLFLSFVSVSLIMRGQSINFEKAEISDTISLRNNMQKLAEDYFQQSQKHHIKIEPNDIFWIEILAEKYDSALVTMKSARSSDNYFNGHPNKISYELFAKAKIEQSKRHNSFEKAYKNLFSDYLKNCTDSQLYSANIVFTTYDQVAQFTNQFLENYKNVSEPSITRQEAFNLLRSYFNYLVFHQTEPIVFNQINEEQNRRYQIEKHLIHSPIDGAEISVITVRKRESRPLPAILTFTIYADQSNINQALIPASKGYVGVLAFSRGKGWSKDTIEPYKHEHHDVYAIIDWISKQPWNNGKVGMFGGSYNGFTQWASMKDKVHPALKTIVPCVSAAPGIDVPMENNVFHNFSYKWISYVTTNTYLYNTDYQRWKNLEKKWFKSGKPYATMDSIDQTPNPLFHEWISHPSYDDYWQSMIPYKQEYAHIDIPILSITGYYDDGQRGALYYYNQHLKYKPDAEHYLLIGPYDHWGAQTTPSANLRGYQLDKVAQIDIQDQLIFDWFDYILKGKDKPEILKDKVNFEVMGENKWIHTPTLKAMSTDTITYYLSSEKTNNSFVLKKSLSKKNEILDLKIDLADRVSFNNADYYPWPIIRDSINQKDGLVFTSEPLQKEIIINGSFSGKLKIKTNKKDFDYAVNLYELTPKGKFFCLSYYIGRASYSKSKEIREQIIPNKFTNITFENTRIISKKLSKGSRIVIIINGNKNPYSQINYGTGKDVSSESIKDASEPLLLELSSKSLINIPIWNKG